LVAKKRARPTMLWYEERGVMRHTTALPRDSATLVNKVLLRCTPRSAKHLMARKMSVMTMRKAPGEMLEKMRKTSPL
jgi:hypothetical protein